jgi:hypothetical protein
MNKKKHCYVLGGPALAEIRRALYGFSANFEVSNSKYLPGFRPLLEKQLKYTVNFLFL